MREDEHPNTPLTRRERPQGARPCRPVPQRHLERHIEDPAVDGRRHEAHGVAQRLGGRRGGRGERLREGRDQRALAHARPVALLVPIHRGPVQLGMML